MSKHHNALDAYEHSLREYISSLRANDAIRPLLLDPTHVPTSLRRQTGGLTARQQAYFHPVDERSFWDDAAAEVYAMLRTDSELGATGAEDVVSRVLPVVMAAAMEFPQRMVFESNTTALAEKVWQTPEDQSAAECTRLLEYLMLSAVFDQSMIGEDYLGDDLRRIGTITESSGDIDRETLVGRKPCLVLSDNVTFKPFQSYPLLGGTNFFGKAWRGGADEYIARPEAVLPHITSRYDYLETAFNAVETGLGQFSHAHFAIRYAEGGWLVENLHKNGIGVINPQDRNKIESLAQIGDTAKIGSNYGIMAPGPDFLQKIGKQVSASAPFVLLFLFKTENYGLPGMQEYAHWRQDTLARSKRILGAIIDQHGDALAGKICEPWYFESADGEREEFERAGCPDAAAAMRREIEWCLADIAGMTKDGQPLPDCASQDRLLDILSLWNADGWRPKRWAKLCRWQKSLAAGKGYQSR